MGRGGLPGRKGEPGEIGMSGRPGSQGITGKPGPYDPSLSDTGKNGQIGPQGETG